MFDSNTDWVDLRAIWMLFVLKAITMKQDAREKIIVHSTSKLQAGSADED